MVLVLCGVQWLAVPGAAADPLFDVAVLPPTGGHVSMVVGVGAFTTPESVTVTVRGARQRTTVVPVMSDKLAVGLVVDASEPGRDTMQAWLSGAARFVLEMPGAARAAVVADTTPPMLVAGLQQERSEVVSALSSVQAHDERRTSEALSLAARQLGGSSTGPRVIVLYTSSPDAGGEPAADLAARLSKAHALLVVVSGASDTPYWSDVTRATGGFLAPVDVPVVVPALDQVATMLRARYLVTFPAPRSLPAPVSVRINTGKVTLTGDAVIPATAAAGTDPSGGLGGGLLWVLVVVDVLMISVTAAILVAAWRAKPRD